MYGYQSTNHGRLDSIVAMPDSEEQISRWGSPQQVSATVQDIVSGSEYSVSAVASSSSFSTKTPESRGRSRKRRLERDPTSSQGRAKRLKSQYRENYLVLYNEILDELRSKRYTNSITLSPSQIGASLWSSNEKDLFFENLSKRGKHNVQSIATGIGSKGVSEVRMYLRSLQDAVKDEQIYELVPKRLLQAYTIESATEVSEECCSSLDLAAEALSVLQQQEEQRSEKKKYGDFSLLTPQTAKWIHERLQAGGLGDDEVAKMLPAATLLNLKTFLATSKCFFMNSKDIDCNWRSYTERRKPPSIMYTAFSDFHTLTISITKRIIQSSLFLAASRLKNLNTTGRRSLKQHVKKADVLAALDVLRIECNSRNFWSRTARKCRLRVYDHVRHRQVFGRRYRYSDVEDILGSQSPELRGRHEAGQRASPSTSVAKSDMISDTSTEDNDRRSQVSPNQSSNEDNASDLSSSDSSASEDFDSHTRKQDQLNDSHDVYAEALDQRTSHNEEQRLWRLLGEHPPDKLKSDAIHLPRVPAAAERKSQDDLTECTARMDYAAEWETYEMPLLRQITRSISNRRDGASRSDLTESDSTSDDLASSISSIGKLVSIKSVNDQSSSKRQTGNSGTSIYDDEVRTADRQSPEASGRAIDETAGEMVEEPQEPGVSGESSGNDSEEDLG